MKLSIIYSFCFIVVCSSCAPLIKYFPKENESELHTYDREYYSNGSIKYETMYKSGVLDGHVKSWDRKGKLISKVEYINGFLHGSWETYYPNGKIKNSVVYREGKKNGVELWFHENGIKQSEALYLNDKINSKITRWDKEGRKIIE